MTLAAGTRLGPYEILSPIGAGGMGEVYRARDPRLGRDVAIKVLPEDFAADPERLRRFESEARSASSLSDPHIVTVFDVGAERGLHYFACELVEGSDVRRVLDAGPPTVRKTLDLAEQIASGLAAAHEKGIVHRDLKPENILLTRSGLAKIADFGLAKLTESGGSGISQLPTTDGHQTSAGVVMGTVGYMSPEQAGGQRVDFRSDQFAFGSILYELLTGRPPFRRATAAETMTAILREEPESLSALAPKTPAPLVWVIERCLSKEPSNRYAATRDLAHDLGRIRTLSGTGAISTAAAAGMAHPRKNVPLAIAIGAAVAAATAAVYLAFRPPPPPPVYQQLTFRRVDVPRAAFAPDGQTVLYSASLGSGAPKVFLTRTNDRDSTPLALPDAVLFAISSSGKVAVGLGANGDTLAETSLAASPPRALAEDVSYADYQPTTETLAAARSGRIEFPLGKVLYDPGPGGRTRNIRFSPDGRRIAFLEDRAGSTSVGVVDLAGQKTLLTSGWSDIYGLAWHPKRKEIWFTAREGPKAGVLALHAMSLSGRQRLVASAPGILIMKDIDRNGRVLLARQDWRFSTLFRSAGSPVARDLSWFEFSVAKALSADGKTLLLDEDDVVYIRPTDGVAPAVRLGDGVAQDLSPDGKWALALPVTSPDHILLLPTGPGEAKSLDTGGINCSIALWFPDGRRIAVVGQKKGERRRIYVMSVDGGALRALTPEGTSLAAPVSPDGKYVPAWSSGRVLTLYPGDGSTETPRSITGIAEDENPQGWDVSSRFLYLGKGAVILRFEIATGHREVWKPIDLTDPAEGGQIDSDNLHITPDGRFCVYTRSESSSQLFLVTGLR